MFTNIYNYRELLKTNVKKDIRGKYKASVLGVLWSFMNPLLQVLVYAIVMPILLRNSINNYVLYLTTGILPWTYFMTVIAGCTTCVKSNAGIIKKVYFPREILPISVMASAFVNFMISCLIIICFCFLYGVGISWHIILVPVIAAVQGLYGLGLGFIFAAIDPYIQDMEFIVNFFLNMMMYASPIIYEASTFAGQGVLYLAIRMNPMTQLIEAYRMLFMYHGIPNLRNILIVLAGSLILDVIGYNVFKKCEKGFAEAL